MVHAPQSPSGKPVDRYGSSSVLIVSLLVTFGLWLPAALNPGGHWATLLDNIYWTFSFGVAAAVAVLGMRHCDAGDRAARRWISLALACLTAGQCAWAAQVYSGWNPFPGPSDVPFLLAGLCALAAFIQIAHQRLTPARRRLAALDVAGFTLAALALVLAIYLPRGSNSTPMQLTVLTTYPVLFLLASAAALVTQLYLRLRWTWRWLAVFGGLVGHSVAWMTWNIKTLDNTLATGSWLNLFFAVVTLLLGWGAAGWRLQTAGNAKFDRICEGSIRQMPLATVAMTCTAVGLLVLDQRLPGVMRVILLGLALLALLSAPLRQSMQLSERDRLLEAERGLAESHAQLEYLAHHDPLTGLANLAMLRDQVNRAIATAGRTGHGVALLFIDLDQFKEVNDTLGHATGDGLLIHTARQLERVVRSTDTVCRHGGDEFAIVLPGVRDISEVVRVNEAIMQLAAGSAMVNGNELSMSMSIGAAFYPHDAHNFESLLQCADIAMYQAKTAGRNAYRFYDSQMGTAASDRMQMRGRLARAMERNELLLHYQPIVDLRSGAITGAEALLRWQHPELGMVPPASFIPVAEDSGLIVPIGEWVLNEACRQGAAWRTSGPGPMTIAVNLSMLQFRRGNLANTVIDALRNSGLPPQLLELEVTESVLMEERDMVTATLARLRKIGVRVAIDDFGTGYSSLAYLKCLPASKLKMDQSLIREIDTQPRDAAVARAVIQMAHELGLITVAEGVETTAQHQMLQNFGCNQAQGYHFGKPVMPEQFDLYYRGTSAAAALSA